MRSGGNPRVSPVLFAALLFATTADAETIRITSGSMIADPGSSNPFELIGDRGGFRLFGTHDVEFGRFSPQCANGDIECDAGDAALLVHVWGPSDDSWAPNATFRGVTFTDMTSPNSRAFAEIGFSTTVTLPSFDGLSTVVLTNPFVLDGTFTAFLPGGGGGRMPLVGSGTMTTTWNRVQSGDPSGPRWSLALARYDFLGPTVVPEPSTLILLGAAGATAAWRRRKLRDTSV